MKRLIIFSILFFISQWAFSQALYEFDYSFDIKNIKEEYKAFFVRNDDGTGFVRVRFTNPETKQIDLVEMQIEEHFDVDKNGDTDSTVLVIETYKPQIINGNKLDGYSPDYFWFKKFEKDGFFEPWVVVSPDVNEIHEGTINKVRLLEQADLTQELVLQYFNADEPFYINLFEASIRTPKRPVNAAPGDGGSPSGVMSATTAKLFMILVANTNDPSIGSTCDIDKNATLKTFQQIAEYLEIPFVPNLIYGPQYNKKNVETAINGLKPSSNDIVVFYYTGHGYANDNDGYTFPYLDLRTKDFQPMSKEFAMNMQDIFKQIKGKGARLNLVLSDCCNADPNLTNNISAGMASLRSSSIGWSLENCQNLFLKQPNTSILMTAAQKGEVSAGNNVYGGFFTFNFRESLEKKLGLFSQFVSWKDLLDAAKSQTIKKANNTTCPNISGDGFSSCKQNPVFILE